MDTREMMLLVDEAIALETNVSQMYLLFSELFPEDHDLWWTLCIEEKNHAALLKSGRETFLPDGLFPEELLYPHLEELRDVNDKIRALLATYQQHPPSRREAFEWALHIENISAEIHFQRFMQITPPHSPAMAIFQQLNREDKDHIPRVQAYMQQHHITQEETV